MAISWEPTTVEEFESFPEPQPPKKDDPYEGVIPALNAGEIIRVKLPGKDNVRGARMAIGRRAKEAGISVSMRYADNYIVVRKTGDTIPIVENRRGRKPKE